MIRSSNDLRRLASRLRVYGKEGRQEMERAAIDMRRRAKPEANRAIRKTYTVKVAPLNERIRATSVPNEFAVTLGVTAADKRRRIPAQDFAGTRALKAGVRVQLLKASPPKIVPRSFLGKGKIAGRLVARAEDERLPLRTVGGFNAQPMLLEKKEVVEGVIETLLTKTGVALAKRILRLRDR